jgi:hypothetical protein
MERFYELQTHFYKQTLPWNFFVKFRVQETNCSKAWTSKSRGTSGNTACN